jgi:2-polyprenyl-6-methoxyphenol hydroxylase-like FAD-dependent oxidoreductase
MSEHSNFRVLIVGGGIGGLTLANSLQHAGVDYLVLESHAEIHPQVGASIAIFGNGGRILDHMGIYEDIYKHTEPTVTSAAWVDGKLRARRDGPELMTARYVICTASTEAIIAKIIQDWLSYCLSRPSARS